MIEKKSKPKYELEELLKVRERTKDVEDVVRKISNSECGGESTLTRHAARAACFTTSSIPFPSNVHASHTRLPHLEDRLSPQPSSREAPKLPPLTFTSFLIRRLPPWSPAPANISFMLPLPTLQIRSPHRLYLLPSDKHHCYLMRSSSLTSLFPPTFPCLHFQLCHP